LFVSRLARILGIKKSRGIGPEIWGVSVVCSLAEKKKNPWRKNKLGAIPGLKKQTLLLLRRSRRGRVFSNGGENGFFWLLGKRPQDRPARLLTHVEGMMGLCDRGRPVSGFCPGRGAPNPIGNFGGLFPGHGSRGISRFRGLSTMFFVRKNFGPARFSPRLAGFPDHSLGNNVGVAGGGMAPGGTCPEGPHVDENHCGWFFFGGVLSPGLGAFGRDLNSDVFFSGPEWPSDQVGVWVKTVPPGFPGGPGFPPGTWLFSVTPGRGGDTTGFRFLFLAAPRKLH